MTSDIPPFPGSASAEQAPPADVAPPPSIALAVNLMRAGAAVAVVNVVVGLVTRNSIRDNLEDSLRESGDLTQSNLDTAYNVTMSSLIILGIASIGLWLWMAYANGRGRRWARVVATALGGIGTLGFVLSLSQGGATALSLVLSALTAALAVAIIVLLWRRESTAYYDSRSRRRT